MIYKHSIQGCLSGVTSPVLQSSSVPKSVEPRPNNGESEIEPIYLSDFLNPVQEVEWNSSLLDFYEIDRGMDPHLIQDLDEQYREIVYRIICRNHVDQLQNEVKAFQRGVEAGVLKECSQQQLLSNIAPSPPPPSISPPPTLELPSLSASTDEQMGFNLSALYTALNYTNMEAVANYCAKSKNTQYNFLWQLWNIAYASGISFAPGSITCNVSTQTKIHTSDISIQASTPASEAPSLSGTAICKLVEASVQMLPSTLDASQPTILDCPLSPSSLPVTSTFNTSDDPPPEPEAVAAASEFLPVQSTSWADDDNSSPILPTYYPKFPPRDFSSLNSGSPSPFQTNSRHILPRRRSHHQFWSRLTPPRRHSQFRNLRNPTYPPPSVNLQLKLNWNNDPRLFELGRALNALGWIRG